MRSPFRLATLASLVLLAANARADTRVPVKYRPTVQKALTWLVEQQNKRTGHWEAQGGHYPVSMTALAGLALLSEGSTVHEGKYARNLRLARDFLTSKAQPSGLVGDPSLPGDGSRYLYGHGYALQFLAAVYGEERDTVQRKKLEGILLRAVKFTREAQTSRGGWGYIAARDGGDFDEGSMTVTQVQALRAARNVGIKVAPEAMKDAMKYLQDATGPDGGIVYSLAAGRIGGGRPVLTAAAIVCGYSAGDYSSETMKKWFQYCQQHIPRLSKDRSGYDEYIHYYHAQAIYGLGDDGYGKLFPTSKQADRQAWTKYRQHTFDYLRQTQLSNGSWAGGYIGPIFATSVYLTILQLDNAALPLSHR